MTKFIDALHSHKSMTRDTVSKICVTAEALYMSGNDTLAHRLYGIAADIEKDMEHLYDVYTEELRGDLDQSMGQAFGTLKLLVEKATNP